MVSRWEADSTGNEVSMLLPSGRGPLSDAVTDALSRDPGPVPDLTELANGSWPTPIADEDFQLALFVLYALHYRTIHGVDDGWEWEPNLIGVRRILEERFESALRELVPSDPPAVTTAQDVSEVLFELTRNAPGPSVSRHIARRASREQVLEWLVHKSPYQLMEADPHTWAIPRLQGRAKAALVEIQADEYGGGLTERVHSELFRVTMTEVGLDPTYGAYLEHVPAITLAGVNAISMFGLNRRLRGAVAGHLAAFEMTSSQPNRHYARGIRRLGWSDAAAEYFDEHVMADAIHEQIAARDLAGGLAEAEPDQWPEVWFGAASLLEIERLAGEQRLTAWDEGRSSLRTPLPGDLLEQGVA